MSSNGSPPLTESITIDNADIPPGWTAYIAAEETPSGVRLSMGSTQGPITSCMNTSEASPVMVNPGVVTNGTTTTITTTETN